MAILKCYDLNEKRCGIYNTIGITKSGTTVALPITFSLANEKEIMILSDSNNVDAEVLQAPQRVGQYSVSTIETFQYVCAQKRSVTHLHIFVKGSKHSMWTANSILYQIDRKMYGVIALHHKHCKDIHALRKKL